MPVSIVLSEKDGKVVVHTDVLGEHDEAIGVANFLLTQLHMLEAHHPEHLEVMCPVLLLQPQ